MKVLAYILTAAAVVIGADVFVMSAEKEAAPTSIQEAPISLHGGSGMPTPPPDAY